PIEDPDIRRQILGEMLARSGSSARPPAAGEDPGFDAALAALSWGGEPLLLMMAGLTAAEAGFGRMLALSRDDLAFTIADRELDRIEKITTAQRVPKAFAWHMAAVVTLCQGLERKAAYEAIEREKAALLQQDAGAPATVYRALEGALSHGEAALDPMQP